MGAFFACLLFFKSVFQPKKFMEEEGKTENGRRCVYAIMAASWLFIVEIIGGIVQLIFPFDSYGLIIMCVAIALALIALVFFIVYAYKKKYD